MIERYQTKEMKAIWSEENKYGCWLRVELAVCRAWSETGQIPLEAMEAIESKAAFDVSRIDEIERVTKHDMIAFVSNVAEHIGEHGRYVHLGLTSSDVIDTASSLQLVEAMGVIGYALRALCGFVGKLAWEHRYTVCAGRTHGVHAEPTTFGLKMLNHYSQLERDRSRLDDAVRDMGVGKISGAVGTYGNCPPYVEARVCELLGLERDKVSNQIIQRDRHAQVINALALMGCSLERLAVEIRHLQRTEVLEALEPFGKGQKGSSAMPHKKNPILCERVCGMSRLLRGYVVMALEDIALWHERDISHSSVERVMWPDAFHTAHYMLKIMTDIISGLVVQPDRMSHNMDITGGLLCSGRVLLELIERLGISREDAYAVVQENAMKSWQNGEPVMKLLRADSRLGAVPDGELEALFDVSFFTRYVDEIYSRFPELGAAEQH